MDTVTESADEATEEFESFGTGQTQSEFNGIEPDGFLDGSMDGACQHMTRLPRVELPAGGRSISAAAKEFGNLVAADHTYYLRGGTPVRLAFEADQPLIQPVRPAEFASDIERVAQPVFTKKKAKGESVTELAICNKGMAELIIRSQPFRTQLPVLRVLSNCPVLVEHDGELVQIVGFDARSGVYARGEAPELVSLDRARGLLLDIISGFRFASPGDHSRALAAMITPALVLGGLLPGRAPVDLGEADHSQAGKGYRNRITAAVYGHVVLAVSQAKGKIGSLEESFDRALIAGHTFIAIDNVRGKIDSPKIESFVTEDSYIARCSYSENTEIDPRRVCVMFTSNRADLTGDLANRCSCVRILKQSSGYQFHRYPEGDVLAHVRANQPLYLGAVFAIVRAWHAAGKPRTNETRHDFREWAQCLDWIVQNLLGEAPLIEGHCATKQRMTNPHLNWLRGLAIAVVKQGKVGHLLLPTDLLSVMEADGEIEIPGAKDGDIGDENRSTVLQQIGKKLGPCFRDGDQVQIDSYLVTRQDWWDDASHLRHQYIVTLVDSADAPPTPANETPF